MVENLCYWLCVIDCFCVSVPMFHVLSMHSKILTTKPYTDLWSHMTGLCCHEQTDR